MSYLLAGTYIMHPDETVILGHGFGPLLASGETLTGTPTVTITPSGELAAGSVQINTTAAFTDKDGTNSIAQNEGVTASYSYSGSGEDKTYTVKAKATNNTTSEVHVVVIHVKVTKELAKA